MLDRLYGAIRGVEVGAGARLRKALTPNHFPREDLGNETPLQLFAGMVENRRRTHAQTDDVNEIGNVTRRQFLIGDGLHAAFAATAVFCGIVDADQAAVVGLLLPRLQILLHPLVHHFDGLQREPKIGFFWTIFFNPFSAVRAVLSLFRGIFFRSLAHDQSL